LRSARAGGLDGARARRVPRAGGCARISRPMSAVVDELESTRMTLGEHLEELRRRLFKSVLVLVLAFAFAWTFREDVAQAMLWPFRTAAQQINAELRARADAALAADPTLPLKHEFKTSPHSFGITEPIFFALNNSVYFALLIGSPFVLWQMWQFVAAGLYRHEKRAVARYFPFSALLFLGGIAFCFLLLVPTGMYYLATMFPIEQIEPVIGIDQYTSFLTTLCLAMGLVFQLPILMIFLARIGLVEPKTYGRYRGHFVVVALIVSAIVTPGPDYVSQLMMAVPMLVLYEIGILVSRAIARPRQVPGG
jgi:sec-independent protein translocase protein TatC